MIERGFRIATLGLSLAVGAADGGAYLVREADIFDELATTFPIEDWIKHARARSDAWVRSARTADDEHGTTCVNTVVVSGRDGSPADATMFGWKSPSPCDRGPALLDGPCERRAVTGAGRPPLPDRPGPSTLTLVLPEELDQMVRDPRSIR